MTNNMQSTERSEPDEARVVFYYYFNLRLVIIGGSHEILGTKFLYVMVFALLWLNWIFVFYNSYKISDMLHTYVSFNGSAKSFYRFELTKFMLSG
jgi:hypothetical protein